MKIESIKWGAGVCCAGLLAAISAQATITLTFDENGSSTSSITTGIPIAHAQVADSLWATANGTTPSGGGVTTLDYLFPYPYTAGTGPQYGWVAIYDRGTPTSDYGTTTGLSDLIHFDNSHVVNNVVYTSMFFYSKDSGADLADHWISSSLTYTAGTSVPSGDVGHNVLSSILSSSHIQFVPEDANGNAFYDASLSTSPGNLGSDTRYEFESGEVPEPTTFISGAFMLLPLGAATLRTLRKKRAE